MPKATPASSERLTRKQKVDPKLTAAGRKVVPYVPGRPLASYHRCAVTEYATQHGPADYALVAGGQILCIVEAKKLTLGPQNVLTQAERYSRGATLNPLNFDGFRVPFLYSTNGEVLWQHDVRHPLNRSRRLAGFHTPDPCPGGSSFDSLVSGRAPPIPVQTEALHFQPRRHLPTSAPGASHLLGSCRRSPPGPLVTSAPDDCPGTELFCLGALVVRRQDPDLAAGRSQRL